MTQLTRLETPAESLSSSMVSSGGAEAVKVIVRCRPLSDQEINAGHQKIVSIDTKRGVIEIKNPKEPQNLPKIFTFDAVYDENSKQMDLYYEVFRELVDSVLKGFNGTIFAYGQTGTGKTHTMEGIRDNPELRGVIPNAIDHIFRHISQSTNQQYLVRASYLEIYQEEIRDLLNTKDKDKRLELKERPDIGVYVKDLNSFVTKSMDDIMQVMKIGNENRSVGRTNMNEHSSRSHAIFMITIECSEPGLDGENHIRVGRLNLVDLAGSERQSKTGSQGERFKEATKINLSLSALGNVISALVDGKSSHIPYRDSKLTRLLQDSLGGNSKTVMVANIGPANYNLEETLSTLRYANRAKNIKNKPKINEDPKDALLREFQDEIGRLKEMLKKRTTSGNRKRRKRQEGMNESLEYNEETSAEEYVKEQQRKLDEERVSLEQNKELREEEKLRLLESLEDRQKQLTREREAQKLVAEKILNMQSKLLSGTGNLLDQTKEQQRLLQERRIELAEQKRREREILQQLEAQEDNTAEIHQTFANLQQEVEVKTKKLQKLFTRLQQVRMEIQDNADACSRERQQLEQSITEINKELKLKWLIVENFIPVALVEKIRERAVFDEDQGIWKVLKPGERPGSNDSVPSEKVEHKLMVDSGLGPGISDVSSSVEDGFKLMPIKRPVSMMGLRRPTTNFERDTMTHLRQRMRSPRTIHAFSNDYMAAGNRLTTENAFAPDNILRFCGENVITFGNLESYPSKVVDYQSDAVGGSRSSSATAKESERKAGQNVVIEVTKIPPPRSASRETRAATNIRRLSAASPSKNARARSAHGRAIASPASPAGSQGSAGSADRSTPTLVFPKARGLDGGKQSSCQSPESVSTSSSSSKDLGFGDEFPEDSEPGEFLQELEAALELDFNFNHERINMGLCRSKPRKIARNLVEEEDYPRRSPTKIRFDNSKQKTRIPVLKLMSQSVTTPRSILKTSQTDVLSRSYHDGTFSTLPTSYYPVQGSQERLVERERNVLEESQRILARVRERKPLETITSYPERAVTFPIHRPPRSAPNPLFKSPDSSIGPYESFISAQEPSINNILTPAHDIMARASSMEDLPPQMKLAHIDFCVDKIVQVCEELKNLNNQPTKTETRESNLTKRDKTRGPLERNPDLDRYQNSFGGKIIPVERQLALYRNHKGKCPCCRWETLLHRIYERNCPLSFKKRSKIGKRNVVRRHPCICDIFHSSDDGKYSKKLQTFVDFPPFTYMIYFGLMAVVFQMLQLMS